MTSPLLESRRELRKCAFQALMSLEFDTDMETACRFAYTHDREDEDIQISWINKSTSTSSQVGQLNA